MGKALAFRWAKDGVDGVLLETVKVGGMRLTSGRGARTIRGRPKPFTGSVARPNVDYDYEAARRCKG